MEVTINYIDLDGHQVMIVGIQAALGALDFTAKQEGRSRRVIMPHRTPPRLNAVRICERHSVFLLLRVALFAPLSIGLANGLFLTVNGVRIHEQKRRLSVKIAKND